MFAGWICGGKEVKVVVFELWLFGDDVGGGDLVVGGWLDQNNDRKKKNGYLKALQPVESHEFPLNNGGELSAHKLTGITDLRTFLVLCKFPQP